MGKETKIVEVSEIQGLTKREKTHTQCESKRQRQ